MCTCFTERKVKPRAWVHAKQQDMSWLTGCNTTNNYKAESQLSRQKLWGAHIHDDPEELILFQLVHLQEGLHRANRN